MTARSLDRWRGTTPQIGLILFRYPSTARMTAAPPHTLRKYPADWQTFSYDAVILGNFATLCSASVFCYIVTRVVYTNSSVVYMIAVLSVLSLSHSVSFPTNTRTAKLLLHTTYLCTVFRMRICRSIVLNTKIFTANGFR